MAYCVAVRFALFLMTVLLSRTDWITTPISTAAGVLVFLVMLIASALPARSRRR